MKLITVLLSAVGLAAGGYALACDYSPTSAQLDAKAQSNKVACDGRCATPASTAKGQSSKIGEATKSDGSAPATKAQLKPEDLRPVTRREGE
jgi:hypothetical protein